MKTNENKSKKGISLIVLVITIIVIIILATAIIVTLLNNNPMSEANKAKSESDRDNMQSIFTNTVAKVMAQKQSTMEIKASALNTVTSGVSSTTGDANYILNNPINNENANGRIIFDNKENTETEYYTGKQLPIYKSGKTTWYVDEEGIISLQVGDKTYGEGKIVKNIKINAKVIASEEYIKNKAKIRIEVAYEDQLQNIIFNSETITSFEKQENVYIVEREVVKNGTYEIEANGQNGDKNKITIEVNQIDNINNNIQINSTVTPSSDYVKATMGIEITFSGEVESIKINGESQAVPSKYGGKYIISKDVLENGEYKVEVKAKDGTINKTIVKVTDLTEDMEIWNRADMESFRDKVNSGRTFENRKAIVMADIDLQGSETNQWIPIANNAVNVDESINENYVFKGTFEGNYHKIKNLYINNNNKFYQGLFRINKGKIYRIQILSGSINNYACTGTIVGVNYTGGEVSECSNKINVTTIGIAGGIVGRNWGTISKCYNTGNITATGQFNCGGIAGYNDNGGKIDYCYNSGTINGINQVGGIAGVNTIGSISGKAIIRNSYNIGVINATGSHSGSISGYNGVNETYRGGTIENCYFLIGTCSVGVETSYKDVKTEIFSKSSTQMKVFTLDDIFVKDTVNKNKGYPILKWQLEH